MRMRSAMTPRAPETNAAIMRTVPTTSDCRWPLGSP